MTTADFENLLNKRLEKTVAVLASKRVEYAPETDVLHNFKRAGALTGRTPAQACVGMAAKHLVSLLDIVDGLSTGRRYTDAAIDEKIGDAVNYLILLEALIREANQ